MGGWDKSPDYGSRPYRWWDCLGAIALGLVISFGIAFCSLRGNIGTPTTAQTEIYANHTMERLNGRVGIPTHVFKAVYDPAAHRAIVFIARNRHTATVEQVSLATLQDTYGIVAFPRLSASVRSDGDPWALPEALNRRCAR